MNASHPPGHDPERLSAAMDGEGSAAEREQAFQHLAQRADERQRWHLYHLVGDTLRNEAMATDVQRDEAFAQRLSQRLAQEPVVLAPRPRPWAQARRARWWVGTAATVAGALVVGGAYWGTRLSPEASPFGVLSAVVAPAVGVPAESVRRAAAGPAWGGTALGQPVQGFKEVLRLPRGPADRPNEALQVLFSDGQATISVHIEPYRAGTHPVPQPSERLNTLTLQRDGAWLTLMGDVPAATLVQFAAALQIQP